MAAQAGRFVLTLGSTMVLARILTPRDFGLITMVTAVTGFLVVFRDLGLPTATVQQEEIGHDQVTTLFWMNTLLGLGIAVVMAALAPAIARFYHEPALVAVAPVLGGVILLDALSLQHRALLRRQMRFGTLAAVEVLSQAAGVAAALVAAWLGGRYWALVLLRVVNGGVQTAACWIVCDWRPHRRMRAGRVASMVAFGGYLSASRLIRYSGRNLDRVLIGRFGNARLLGPYAKAAGWLVTPFQQLSFPVARVAVPVLSRLQRDPERYRRYWSQGMLLLAVLGVPAILYLAVDAENIVLLLLGDQWGRAIPLVRILSPVAFATLVGMGNHWAYVSLGRAARQLVWEIVVAVATAAALLTGLRWGPTGVAWGYSIAAALLTAPGIAFCFRGSPLRAGDLLGVFWRPAAAAAVAALGLGAFRAFGAGPASPAGAVLAGLPTFAAAYILVWMVLPRGPSILGDLVRLVRELRSPGEKPLRY